MDIRKRVGWNVRRLRLKLGISQEALAGVRMVAAHVSRIERGIENPTVLILDKIAKALGVDVLELFKPVKPGLALPAPLKKGPKPESRGRRR